MFMKFIQLLYLRAGASFRSKPRSSTIRQQRQKQIMSMSQCQAHNGPPTVSSLNQRTTPFLPSEWKTLDTQVGGHQFVHGEYEHQKLGIVDIGNGMILKSLQNPPRGTRELNFYQTAFDPNCDDTCLLELRPFLSPFYGMEEKDGAKFLKLANLTCGFKHPCVIDLKMGRVTYDQEATAEKIAHEVEKYPPLKNLGFQITGMLIYNPVTGLNEQYEKAYCKNLTEENIVHDGLGRFFQLHNNDLRRDVIQPLISKLKKLESWFLKQKKFSFIASSLLIVYEGSKSASKKIETSETQDASNVDQNGDKNKNNLISGKDNLNCLFNAAVQEISVVDSSSSIVHVQKRVNDGQLTLDDENIKKVKHSEVMNTDSDMSQNENSKTKPHTQDIECSSIKEVEVCLIDFAHAFPATDIDHNFLFGLQKVISSLQSLLK